MSTLRRRIIRWTSLIGALIAVTALLVGPTGREHQAAALTGATWCTTKASMAVIGGSSSTGYLTEGYASPDNTYHPTTYGWWRRLTAQAAAGWGTTATNYARNSAKAADFLPGGRWPITTGAVADIDAKNPALVIVSLGTNEYLAQVPPAQFEADLVQLVDDIKTASPGTAVVLVAQWTAYVPAATYPWSQYVTAIRNTAVAEVAGLVDLRQYLISAGDQDWSRFYNIDRIHLLDHSHMIVAAAMAMKIFGC
ncbi:SGNH/GDSL hydrolase family protein [Saccharothrix texasensis]|uniref:Acyl-CoA thioesterase-1 n=1 Tax=Saccharothrix texasensis TaxID=103734 RepID=A0A3N1H177_9PSEU|nr:SGNH/GDSL hydrolase family protein [Saccharothrix texasensis]ROP36295.1 acyl-CoA thioesterase-1 [Saccharothrix texasensis]